MSQATAIERERSRIAAAVYGTILVLAVLSYVSESDELGPGDVAAAMVGTGIAYFAAHAYVDYLAARMTGERDPTLTLTRRVLVEEWPLLQAMLAPGVPLVPKPALPRRHIRSLKSGCIQDLWSTSVA